VGLVSVLLTAHLVLGGHDIDPQLAEYKSEKKLQGTITSRGSDTMRLLMIYWAEGFRKHHPQVVFDIKSEGSGTAPGPLLQGTSQIGPMSRKMNEKEYETFMNKYGVRPVAVGVGLDTLAVYVNQQNPIDHLSLVELDAIFSSTRQGGYPENIAYWGQLNLGGPWQNRPIHLYTRNSVSGTFEYFRNRALYKGKYKNTIQMQPDSATVVNKVIADPGGIGYSGIGYNTDSVKTLAISEKLHGETYTASSENVYLNQYPLSRPLYIYVVRTMDRPVPERVAEFLRFVMSQEGQQIILDTGYMPLSAQVTERQLDLVR